MSDAGLLKDFSSKKIMVIGDIMLDKFIWGDVSRISPEAPVQIVNVQKESYALGGAANVANNIAALGASTIMVGIVGNDEAQKIIQAQCEDKKIETSGMIIDEDKPTIQKVRILGKQQQLLRVDYEKKEPVSKEIEAKLLDHIRKNIDKVDAIALSDYAKGVVTEKLAKEVIELCNKAGKPVIVDPKPENSVRYKGATIITPNHHEAHEMSRLHKEKNNTKEIEMMGDSLRDELNASILITRGEKGMSIFDKKGTVDHIPTYAQEVYDIVGAGDSVVAALTLALACNASLKDAANIANHAAGIVVKKVGTATVSVEELEKSMEK